MRGRFWMPAGAALVASSVLAAPLTPAEITRLCTNADGPVDCARRIEAEQMKRLPGIATREGSALKLTLFPSGSVTLTDVDTLAGGTSYALWDYSSELNATVLWTAQDDNTGFLLLQRVTGRRTPLPSDPVVAPDRQRIATADFCATRCENALVVWRVSRDAVQREAEWRPSATWSDAGVRWKDTNTLTIEYTAAGDGATTTIERKLADPGWVRR